MIFLKRKRLLFWLLRAYLKKWGRTIFLSFILSIIVVLLLFLNRNFFLSRIPTNKSESIGLAGVYLKQDAPDNLPEIVKSKASRGLTKISQKGEVLPDLAEKWDIKDDGKTFIFYLKPNIYFSDGKPFDSNSIRYNFADVVIERPSRQVIVFKLKDKYSPFLVTLANHKVFKKNYVGVSDFKITKIVKDDGGFIDYVQLYSKNDKKIIKYDFYPTQDALKSAYVLGEVSQIIDINGLDYHDKVNLSSFKNSITTKQLNLDKIVTIFFNNQDPLLSDKKIRKALAYSLPETFSEGRRTYTPYGPDFWANNKETYSRDIGVAKSLLSESDASKSGKLIIHLKVLPQYETLAKEIKKSWKIMGVETAIETTDSVSSSYQAFLGELPIFEDPDQYTLWHTGQESNITNYKNLRIDKLLEDGRRTYEISDRKKIYADFQKYLIDDMPATFLFFPYTYNITKK